MAEITTDRMGRIVAWDAGAEALYGYGATEILGRTIWVLTPAARSGEVASAWARVLDGEYVEYEVTHLAKDGRHVRVKGSAEPARDAEGRIVGVHGRMQRAPP